jgi:hypothetical protein
MKLELSKGYAEIRDFCPVGPYRKYQRTLLDGVGFDNDDDNKKKRPSLGVSIDAQMVLVVEMTLKIVLNEKETVFDGKSFEENRKFIDDNLSVKDYIIIREKCTELKDAAYLEAEPKKKS